MLKALAQQEKQATRMRQRDTHTGPKDDLDIEMDKLLAQEHAQFGCDARRPTHASAAMPLLHLHLAQAH